MAGIRPRARSAIVCLFAIPLLLLSFNNCSSGSGSSGAGAEGSNGGANNPTPPQFRLYGIAPNANGTSNTMFELHLDKDPEVVFDDSTDLWKAKLFGHPWYEAETGIPHFLMVLRDTTKIRLWFTFWLRGQTEAMTLRNNGSQYYLPLESGVPWLHWGTYPLNNSFVFMSNGAYYQNADGSSHNMTLPFYIHFDYTNDHQVSSMISVVRAGSNSYGPLVAYNYYRPDGSILLTSRSNISTRILAQPLQLLGQVPVTLDLLACFADGDNLKLYRMPNYVETVIVANSKVLGLAGHQLGTCTVDPAAQTMFAVFSNPADQTAKLVKWNLAADTVEIRSIPYGLRALKLSKPLKLQ